MTTGSKKSYIRALPVLAWQGKRRWGESCSQQPKCQPWAPMTSPVTLEKDRGVSLFLKAFLHQP